MFESRGQVNSRGHRLYTPDEKGRTDRSKDSLEDLNRLKKLLKEKDMTIEDIKNEMNISVSRAKSMITSLSSMRESEIFDFKKVFPGSKKKVTVYSWLSRYLKR